MISKATKNIFLGIGILLFIFVLGNDSHAAKTGHAKAAPNKAAVKVTEIKHVSNPNYTRIIIYLSGQASYSHRLLKEDPKIQKPRRLYVDIKNASRSSSLKQPIPINDGLLKMARAGQYDKG